MMASFLAIFILVVSEIKKTVFNSEIVPRSLKVVFTYILMIFHGIQIKFDYYYYWKIFDDSRKKFLFNVELQHISRLSLSRQSKC